MTLLEQIHVVRELLDGAKKRDDIPTLIGDLLVAVSRLADVAEELAKELAKRDSEARTRASE